MCAAACQHLCLCQNLLVQALCTKLLDMATVKDIDDLRCLVLQVKPLGIYAMIDDGELDWKVIAISLDDPKAEMVNDVADVEK